MGFITRALGRRITKALDEAASTPEGQAAIERDRRQMEFVEIVRQIAGSGLDDEAACSEVRNQLPEDPEVAQGAIKHFGELRTSYLDDRAYRLLTAAVDAPPVRPIDPNVADQFAAEARLGRMSLSDAFAYLVSLEPRLADEPARRAEERQTRRSGFSVGRSEPELVGAWAESPHPVLNTDLAAAVVREYSAVTRGGRVPRDESTPFFERKKRTGGGSFALFGKGDTRPRAQN
jgi:hypothetical protein